MLNKLMEWLCAVWFGGHVWIYSPFNTERICIHCGKLQEKR